MLNVLCETLLMCRGMNLTKLIITRSWRSSTCTSCPSTAGSRAGTSPPRQSRTRQYPSVLSGWPKLFFVKFYIYLYYRVIPELNISNLRLEIETQLDHQDTPLPENYIFIRNVGRHFATVRTACRVKYSYFGISVVEFMKSLHIYIKKEYVKNSSLVG